ncbi:response regulator [Limibacter armeniacum]|uniref:response regulator n=1 Tax=Limibacter armeniacum TaxID=466084 RepID=UPI002FE65E29
MKNEVVHILLVEDHYPDIVLTRKAFERYGLKIKLHTVRNGEEALDYLNKRGAYTDAVCPDLVLLDINLPRKSGFEVLQEIRSRNCFETLPVIMLTSSASEQDMKKSYSLNANTYLIKPCCLGEYEKLIKCVESFKSRNCK